MLVITGGGRSGTSLLAAVYQQAGVDPGGAWDAEVNAGLEDRAVVELNMEICAELGVSLTGRRWHKSPVQAFSGPLKRLISSQRRAAIMNYANTTRIVRYRTTPLINWSRRRSVVELYGEDMRSMARARVLAKDPQFTLTLPFWLGAGAEVDHVVITTREMDAMLASRAKADHFLFRSESDARNMLLYAYGNLFACVHDFRTEHTVLRFPNFLSDIGRTADLLPLCGGVSRAALRSSLIDLVDEGMVHHT